MIIDLFRGKLVRLVKEEPDTIARSFSGWARDSEYMRLVDEDPVIMLSTKMIKQKMEDAEENFKGNLFYFHVKTLADDRLIGFVNLSVSRVFHRDAWVGIGLGDRDYWGHGYGTEAMQLALRYAFLELNLYRVTLDVFEYNPRAIRSYEKAGFTHEGRYRESIRKDGKWYDVLIMGILKDEWLARNKELDATLV